MPPVAPVTAARVPVKSSGFEIVELLSDPIPG
jgi:hypothetical protein